MRKFAFIYTPSEGWVGGKNYYISTIQSLNSSILCRKTNDYVYIFSSVDSDLTSLERLERVKVFRTRLLSSSYVVKLLIRLVNNIFGQNFTLFWVLRSNKIDLLCHSFIPSWTRIKSLPWIPDFQQCYLPFNFSKISLMNRNRVYAKYLGGDNVLFSSYSALNDAKKFFDMTATSWVYRFRPLLTHDYNEKKYKKLLRENSIHGKYVFLPNQFWIHKNHKVVFEAVKLAVEEGKPFNLVCTGKLSDFRHPSYPNEMLKYITSNRLEQYIKFLGLVERNVFNCLLRQSELVINPSYFEGWSSTVEEAKALGKKMVLSNIDVHKEQLGQTEGAVYFNPDSSRDCLWAINRALSNDKKAYTYEIQDDLIYEILDEIVPETT